MAKRKDQQQNEGVASSQAATGMAGTGNSNTYGAGNDASSTINEQTSTGKKTTAGRGTIAQDNTDSGSPAKGAGRGRKAAASPPEGGQQDAAAAAAPKRGGRRKADPAEMGAPYTEAAQAPKAPKGGGGRKANKAQPETMAITPQSAAAAAAQENQQSGASEGEGNVNYNVSRFTDFDMHLFREGRHFTLYEKLGSHLMEHEGKSGTYFAVWAPNAQQVSVMGDFNSWNRESHPLKARQDHSGIWEGFVADVTAGMLYKYHIRSNYHLYHVEKSDPFAFRREVPPQTASIVSDLNHEWQDSDWLQQRSEKAQEPQPYTVYELHAGSWRRKPEDNNRPLTYREMAEELPAYAKEMGFTHVEFMPLMFHPFNGSWGYQITGYFAAASNFGSPQDLMYLIDCLHKAGIGVILDWVPSHFPSDEHGLAYFDGTHLYEHADPRKGYHPDWNSYIFNYGRNEVRSFLISNAIFWLDKYHIDGLRVDAVASMLYLDYSRKHDEWVPNEYGGRENLEAISLLKDFNQAVHDKFPDVKTIAEESTAWPGVTGAVEDGGLGFDMKWMMGWMHDTLTYFAKDPIYRRHHQGDITFSLIYAFTERFMLPLSHDEVVHGKGSLIRKMPGDDWQRFANLRALYAYMYAHPGAKLMFMGAEIAQATEWNHDSSLDWHVLENGYHAGIQQLVRRLNHIFKEENSFYEMAFDPKGFEWVDHNDAHNSVMSFLRKGSNPDDQVLVVCNFTPAVHDNYRLGVDLEGNWQEIFNSDENTFGGSNYHLHGNVQSVREPFHGKEYSMLLKLPPMSVMYFKYQP